MARRKTTMIRIDQDVYDSIVKIAEQSKMSVAKVTNTILRQQLAEIMGATKNEE
jgi:hypothetical protein